jgi:hypothetical protein
MVRERNLEEMAAEERLSILFERQHKCAARYAMTAARAVQGSLVPA